MLHRLLKYICSVAFYNLENTVYMDNSVLIILNIHKLQVFYQRI